MSNLPAQRTSPGRFIVTGESNELRLPRAPGSIQKGSTLKDLLDVDAIECLAHNLTAAHPPFKAAAFRRAAFEGLAPFSLVQRGQHLARLLRGYLPQHYGEAVAILLRSLTPPQTEMDDLGLGVFLSSA